MEGATLHFTYDRQHFTIGLTFCICHSLSLPHSHFLSLYIYVLFKPLIDYTFTCKAVQILVEMLNSKCVKFDKMYSKFRHKNPKPPKKTQLDHSIHSNKSIVILNQDMGPANLNIKTLTC